ncbi:ribosome small subunit-dependent GTPase A [Desulfobacterales bacterium HSG17]|nr:ribosome small subunit-dependent GTPase A [Desulfobacterales bacterium HSG17]
MKITIQKTIIKDLRTLKKLTKNVISNQYTTFLKANDVGTYLNSGASDREIDKGWRKGWTIRIDGRICGYSLCHKSMIHVMMIDPDWQRKGLGTALMQHCQTELLQNYDEINLECFKENQSACDFYQKNGWAIREIRKDHATGLHRIFFHKQKKEPNALSIGLAAMGMDPVRERSVQTEQDKKIARVTGVRKNVFLVNDGYKESWAKVIGKLHHQTDEIVLFPVVGDWVYLKDGRIESVLPRKNTLSRGASGRSRKKETAAVQTQLIAANLDHVFIVCGLDRDFNLRRIERYLTLVYNCGCSPVVILSKSDLHDEPKEYVQDVEAVSFGVPVHLISAKNKTGINALSQYLAPGKTAVLMGSSGAGKSTLLNLLAGKEVQATGEVSDYAGKGIHTTTTRDLIVLPGGGLIIDNPGIREIAFWDVSDIAESTFPDIDTLATSCRFSDCTHMEEPGCRVREAVGIGSLKPERLESYMKQMRELDYLNQRKNKSANQVEKERWQWVALKVKQMKKSGKVQP